MRLDPAALHHSLSLAHSSAGEGRRGKDEPEASCRARGGGQAGVGVPDPEQRHPAGTEPARRGGRDGTAGAWSAGAAAPKRLLAEGGLAECRPSHVDPLL